MDATQRVRAMLSFTQAAELGSFAAAARVLGISAAAVSKNVAGLEGALGVRLMNRSTRALQLTPEGGTFLERAREALAALDAAVDSVAAEHGTPAGRVRLSTGVAFGQNFLMPRLNSFVARYPDIRLEIDFDDRRVDLVREGYDLGLRGGLLKDSSLISRRICSLRQILVASPAYLAAQGVPRQPEDLARHRLIGLRFLSGRNAPWQFRDATGAIAELPITPSLILSDSLAATEAAADGLGITQVATHHAWRQLQTGRLRILLPGIHHPAPLDMAIQYPHRALLAARVRVTIDYLVQAFADEPALHADAEVLAPFGARP